MNLNLLVSIIIYALMAFFVGCGLYHIVNLSKYQKDFALIGKRIKTDAQAVIDLQEYLDGTNSEQNKLFQSDKLDAKLEEYRAAYQRTKSTSFAAPFVDITDFFNGEFLDELGHAGFCELIPGTMTGLGILGTFVGLVLGVGGFDTSTTDAVMVSITHLLGGMSTAFLTSIVGVLLSLAFSHIYKKSSDSTNQSLEDFVTAFHDKNLDGSSSNAENQLLGYQQQQTELMKNFATVVSEAVSTSIANTMRTELVPIFDEMKSTVKEFSEIASQQQKDGLDKVVQKFIQEMDKSLGEQFTELAKTIDETNKFQKNSMEQMQKVVDGICNTSNEIERINEISRQTIEEMNAFVAQTKAYQEQIHSEAELVQKRLEDGNEISNRQAEYIEKLVESETRIADLADNVKKEADAAQKILDTLSEHCKEQVKDITSAAMQEMDKLHDATKVLIEQSHSQMDTLAKTAKDEMENLSAAATELSQKNNEQLIKLTKASSEQLAQISMAANDVIQNNKQYLADLTQDSNDFADFVKQEQKTLTETVKAEVSGLSNFAGQTTTELHSATAGMENAAKLLDKNLDNVLESTFKSFDDNLSDISRHLSGTIRDIRDTTDRMMLAIHDSQKQYQTVLDSLTSETQSYLAAMEKLTALVEQKAPVAADEEGNRQ